MLRANVRHAAPLLLGLLLAAAAWGQEAPVIHDMHYPDLNQDGTQVAFSWQGDVWVADLDGAGKGLARRLTVHAGYDSRPRYSPDGSQIAFISDRNGGLDIYTVPATGGEITRVTWHSAGDILADWTRDGSKLLLYSGGREVRYTAPYELELATGAVRPLLVFDRSVTGRSYSPDGRYLYGEIGGSDWWRKGYRGSANSDVFQYDTVTDELKMLTDWQGDDNWALCSTDGGEVYYVTERFGRPNLVAQEIASGEIRQITHESVDQVSFPSLSGDGKRLVYEANFDIHTVDVRGGTPVTLEIRAPIDYPASFEKEETVTSNIEEMEINRDGTWAAIRVFDDIFLVKTDFKNGSVRVTDWPGQDADFFWHPDGKRLYFISQKNRTGDIWVYDTETKQTTCALEDDRYYLEMLGIGRDGEELYFRRNTGGDGIWRMKPDTGEWNQFLSEPEVASLDVSPDGKWVAAEIRHAKAGQNVYVRPVEGGDWIAITKTSKGAGSPLWSPDGKRLYFTSGKEGSWQLYAVELTREPVEFDDYEAQYQAEEDKKREAEAQKQKAEEQKAAAQPPADATAETASSEPPWPEWKPKPIDPMTIDFTRIDQRARRLGPAGVAEYAVGFSADKKNLLFVRGNQVWTMDLDGKNARQLLQGDHQFGSVRVTADGKWLYYTEGGKLLKCDAVRGGGGSEISFRAELDKDARTIQKWAFQQAWAWLDERFYSHDLHGVDWKAAYDRYAPHCTGTLTPNDFTILVNKMIGELNASHLGCSPPPSGLTGKDTARLGITPDFGYRGPGIKVAEVMPFGPCDQPNATVAVGEFVVAIDGEDVSLNEKTYQLLADQAGKRVKLLVNGQPSREGAREISIKPISGGELSGLQYKLWVERNRELVSKLSGGRVYYAHMAGMNQGTLAAFDEELRGQAQLCDALIVDVRNNGGGNTHDQVLDLLARKLHGWNGGRGTPLRTSPGYQFDGPMACLINQSSFSDAEIFPNGFRERGLGKVIGIATTGHVIGTNDSTLINGCTFRVPWVGWYRMDGANLENLGVQPDIEVPITYADFRAGRDPQLETAVRELLEELAARGRAAQPAIDGHSLTKP